MCRISPVSSKNIVDKIKNLSAQERIQKTPLALALKEVKRAQRSLVAFSPEQAGNVSDSMCKAHDTLLKQNSSALGKKIRLLSEVGDELKICFTRSMDKLEKSINFNENIKKSIRQIFICKANSIFEKHCGGTDGSKRRSSETMRQDMPNDAADSQACATELKHLINAVREWSKNLESGISEDNRHLSLLREAHDALPTDELLTRF